MKNNLKKNSNRHNLLIAAAFICLVLGNLFRLLCWSPIFVILGEGLAGIFSGLMIAWGILWIMPERTHTCLQEWKKKYILRH